MLDQMHSISGTTFEEDGASLPGLMRQIVRGEGDDKKMKTEERKRGDAKDERRSLKWRGGFLSPAISCFYVSLLICRQTMKYNYTNDTMNIIPL